MKVQTLSFEVLCITERHDGRVIYFETTLRSYSGCGTLVIRGKPWRIGKKVDFAEIQKGRDDDK